MTRQNKNSHDAYISLNWYDIQELLAGHHPLALLKIVMQHEAPLNPPTRLELGDQLNNAEYLCKIFRDMGIHVADLEPMSDDICQLTLGLTTVVDSVVEEIIAIAFERNLCLELEKKQRPGVWRKTGLVDAKMSPIKRKKPLGKGANYADPENKAFPLDTPERVKASHAYLHKYWNNGASSGITATYSKQKFIDVHHRIVVRMRRLGIEHNSVDNLDTATRKHVKKLQKTKAESMQDNSGFPKNGSKKPNSDMLDSTKTKKLRNELSGILSDHILFFKNYISACDERNDGMATTTDEAVNENSRELLVFLKRYLPGYKPGEKIDREDMMKQFMAIWDDYIDSAKSLVVGGDTGNDGMARDGLRRLLLVKNKLVRYFTTILANVADEKELDNNLASWVTHLQGYVEARDNDDFATSLQHLQDWRQAKDKFVENLCSWITDRNTDEANSMPEPREIDLDVDSPSYVPPKNSNGVNNPPAPLESAIKTANNVRREVNTPEANRSVTANKAISADLTTRRTTVFREAAIGHIPFGDNCACDARNGKCYKKH